MHKNGERKVRPKDKLVIVLDDYDLLKTLGYEISDEELSLKNGTHELFEEGDN